MYRSMLWIRSAALTFSLVALSFQALAQQGVLTDDTMTVSTQPQTNFGTATSLSFGMPGRVAQGHVYLKFALSALPPGTTGSRLENATLLLWANTVNGTPAFDVLGALGQWNESTLTFDNAPAAGAALVSGVQITGKDQFVAVNLTNLVREWLDGSLAKQRHRPKAERLVAAGILGVVR